MGFSLHWKEFHFFQFNSVAQVGFPPSRVTPGSAWIKHGPGALFSGEIPGEDLVPC